MFHREHKIIDIFVTVEFEKNNAASKLVRPRFYQSIIPAGWKKTKYFS